MLNWYNKDMEIAIGIGVGLIIAALIRGKKKHHEKLPLAIETSEDRKRRETDELITVVLPTINHDK